MHRASPTFSMRKLCSLLTSSLLLLTLSCGCQRGETPETLRLSGQTMGTTWSLIMVAGSADAETAALEQRLQNRLDLINGLMSTYDPDSELSRFNNQGSSDWFAI